MHAHGLRHGQVARGKRIAKMIAKAVCGVNDNWNVEEVIRGLVVTLKSQRMNVRLLDSENGPDAIAAVFSSMTTSQFRRLGVEHRHSGAALGRYWDWIAKHAERDTRYLGYQEPGSKRDGAPNTHTIRL